MNAAQPRLLIVEDDDAIRMQLKYALRDQYALTFAETRMKALALMNDVRPEIVSLDLGLPPHPDDPTEGLKLLEEIHTLSPETIQKFGSDRLKFTVPFVLFGLFRYLYLVHRRGAGGQPELVLLRDRPTQVNLAAYVATVLWAIYL